jgi:hypothetical protein
MSAQRPVSQLHLAQHAVLTTVLTHQLRLGILDTVKSNYLSFTAQEFYLCFSIKALQHNMWRVAGRRP